jgi:hypothetical protein
MGGQHALLPPASPARVDFVRDIQPIFEASCVQCHGRNKSKGGFSLETREDFIYGGDTGSPAEVGKSGESLVIKLVAGLDPETVMPKKGKKLTAEQVGVFRAWIDQGMPWPDEVNFFKHTPANIQPRELADLVVPAGFANPVDGFVDVSFTQHESKWPGLVDDRTYARRVWLDTIGLLPPPAELAAFLADRAPDKRERLVERLLSDNQAYAEHWLTFWNDLLRNDYKGTGYIDGGRKQITRWLYTALARNLPYDRFAAQLVDPGVESEGFVNGIVWRGVVNASMVPPMQAAQGVSQVLLGVNLKCASCHDSFINEYTLKDSYGLASLYADRPLEIAECDQPTGQFAKGKFLFEKIGEIDPHADRGDRLRRLAALMTSRENGRLARTVVNRLWQVLWGRGLVEPVDEMDKPAWSPALLDWLAEDFVVHGYDLKHTLARMLTSRAYQLPAVSLPESTAGYVFQGPVVRRMSAEQFTDAVRLLADLKYKKADAKINRLLALTGPAAGAALPLSPQWIWVTPQASTKAPPAIVQFTRKFALAEVPAEAILTIAADNTYEVILNGEKVGSASSRSGTVAASHDISAQLVAGENLLRIKVINYFPDGDSPAPRTGIPTREFKPEEGGAPAGLILYARMGAHGGEQDLVSDASWTAVIDQTTEPVPVFALGGVTLAPWRLGDTFLELAAAPKDTLPVTRASLMGADPLMVALGRPNREQIVTVRSDQATTLQALELTNGSTFAGLLKEAADKLLAGARDDTGKLVTSLYEGALSRQPSPHELQLAAEVVGSPAKSEGVQDLLWGLAMLPEFQLIH